MKKINGFVIVALVVTLLMATFSVIHPKAVIAAIATLIRDQDNQARHPFVGGCGSTLVKTNDTACQIPVPAGEEVVIQTVEMFGDSDVHPNAEAVVETTPGLGTSAGLADGIMRWIIPDNGFLAPTQSRFIDTRATTLYAGQGTFIGCELVTPSANPVNALFITCAVTGYYVTLP